MISWPRWTKMLGPWIISLYFDVMIILFTISWFFQNYQDKSQPLYSVRIQTGITSWWRSMGTRRPSARWPWARSTLTSFHTRSNHASIMLPPSFRMRSNDYHLTKFQVSRVAVWPMAVRITLILFHISHHISHYQSMLTRIVSPQTRALEDAQAYLSTHLKIKAWLERELLPQQDSNNKHSTVNKHAPIKQNKI